MPFLSKAEDAALREIWWRAARRGDRYPAERGVILLGGGRV